MKKIWSLLCAVMLISVFTFAYAADDGKIYTIDDISFSGIMGQVMENPSRSCMINVDVTKKKAGDDSNALIIATYATDGTMIGYSVMTGNFKDGATANFGTMVNTPEDKSIGVVRAYVWDSVANMRPLSNVGEKVVNQMDPGVIIYDPSDDRYIPGKITIDDVTVSGTFKTSYGLNQNEYLIEMEHPYSDKKELEAAKTDAEYEYIVNRRKVAFKHYFGFDYETNNISNLKCKSEIDLSEYLFQIGRMTFTHNADGELVITDFVPDKAKNDVLVFNSADYVKNADLGPNAYATSGKVRFDTKYYTIKTATTTNVNPVSLYVNGALYATFSQTGVYTDAGVAVTTGVTPNALLDKFLGDAQGTVTLIKGENENGYSKIFVNYYEVARVAAVRYRSNATTINFTLNNAVDAATNAVTTSIANKIVINDDSVEDGDVSVSVMLGDKEIGLNEIREDDIIAIKTDLNDLTTRTFTDPRFIDIIVSRDSSIGMLTSVDDYDETVRIGSISYKAVDFYTLKAASTNGKFAVGEIYKVILDPFGRVYDYEATETTKNYAILEKVNTSNDTVTLVMGDGSYKAFDLSGSGTATLTNANRILYVNGISGAKKAPQDRVVEYTTKSSTGAVSSLTVVAPVNAYSSAGLEYKARTGKLGSYAISDSAKIINAEEYMSLGSISDYKAMSAAQFIDGEEYIAYVYNKVGTFYSFVLIEKTGDKINASTRFAVARGVAGEGTSTVADGDECFTMDVLNNGEEQTMEFATSVNVANAAGTTTATTAGALTSALKAGSAFFYDTDSDGLVSDVWVIYDYAAVGTSTSYATMTGAFQTTSTLGNGTSGNRLYDATKWAFGMQNATNKDMQLAFGVVVSRDSNSIDLGVKTTNGSFDVIDKNTADNQTTLQGIYNFSFAKDCVAYSYIPYDTVNTYVKDKIVVETSPAALEASSFKLFETYFDSDVIFWKDNTGANTDATAATVAPNALGNNIEDYANYALVLLVDDEVVAVYEILR